MWTGATSIAQPARRRFDAAALLACLLLVLLSGGAAARTIEVLWYSYAEPDSQYTRTIAYLARIAGDLPRAGGIRWNLTWFRPDAPAPDLRRFNVLVIQSGEAYFTGRMLPHVDRPDPAQPHAKVDFGGILRHRAQIRAARGDRTYISGSDADVHMKIGRAHV